MNIFILIFVLCVVVWKGDATYDSDYLDLKTKSLFELNRVLVCLKTENQLTELTKIPNTDLKFTIMDRFPDLYIEYHLVNECESMIEEQKNIVAVIAPKPFDLTSEIPMYFFDTPFLDEGDSEDVPKYFFDNRYQNKESNEEPDVDAFPNGLFPLRGQWQSLKYAFSHYLMTHGWKRIAIVSDDSYYSQAFETKLVEHLREKEFVCSVQRCVTTPFGCTFERALRFLKRKKVYIIIANIQGKNAQNLINAAHNLRMVTNRYVWLVRDWPFEDGYTRMFQQMVSLTLSPLPSPDYKLEQDGPHLNSVWRGLALVSRAITCVKEKERIDYYYKSLYNVMNNTNKCDQSKLFIRKFTSGKLINIHSTVVHISGHVGLYPKDLVMADEVSDLPEFCLVRSRSFEDPCNDTWIVIICVVWLMFIIMVVLLVYFFNRCLVWT